MRAFEMKEKLEPHTLEPFDLGKASELHVNGKCPRRQVLVVRTITFFT